MIDWLVKHQENKVAFFLIVVIGIVVFGLMWIGYQIDWVKDRVRRKETN